MKRLELIPVGECRGENALDSVRIKSGQQTDTEPEDVFAVIT